MRRELPLDTCLASSGHGNSNVRQRDSDTADLNTYAHVIAFNGLFGVDNIWVVGLHEWRKCETDPSDRFDIKKIKNFCLDS
jgi:hypothetical protein